MTEADWSSAKYWAAQNPSFDFARDIWSRWDFGLPPEVKEQISNEMTRHDMGQMQYFYRTMFLRVREGGHDTKSTAQ